MKFTSFTTSATVLLIAYLASDVQARPSHKKTVPSCYHAGQAQFTQYWIPKQGTKDMTNDGTIVTLSGPKVMALKTPSGSLISRVDKHTYSKCQMEGTCLLTNGDLVNLSNGKTTFSVIDPKHFPFGIGANDNPLVPFVSVAANDVPQGTILYVKQLDGLKLANGKKHNGCVRVDDQGWSFGNCQFDFFMVEYAFYDKMQNIMPSHISAEAKHCKILDYATKDIIQWMGHGKGHKGKGHKGKGHKGKGHKGKGHKGKGHKGKGHH